MSSRDEILSRIRGGLGRAASSPVSSPPPVRIAIQQRNGEERVASFLGRAAALAAKTFHAQSAEQAREYVSTALGQRRAVASNASILREIGITQLPNVETNFVDREKLRSVCEHADCGITSADYALADTGTLVMLSGQEEARMISLLPPAHIAVVPVSRLLTGLDELLTILPKPALRSSSMVLITGPSRTGDIEQFLVRGVHGPGEIHLVVV